MIRRLFFILAVALPLAVGLAASVWIHSLWALVVIVPFLLVGFHDVLQRRHSRKLPTSDSW